MKIIKKIGWGLGIGILGILYLILGSKYNFLIHCPIYEITGLYCPGCGITRMLISILKGEFYQAFRYNPLLFGLMPLIILYFIDLGIAQITKKKTLVLKLEPYIWYGLVGIFIIYGILRNIPLFDYLKPTVV